MTDGYEPTIIQSAESLVIPPLIPIPEPGIVSRKLQASTCREFEVYSTGRPFEVVSVIYSKDGIVTGAHVRKGGWASGDKVTSWVPGSTRNMFGVNRNLPTGSPVYLFEGETDAMQAYQLFGTDAWYLAFCGTLSPELEERFLSEILTLAGEGGKITLAFDSDKEGCKLTDTWSELLADCNVTLSYMQFDGYKDLCECVIHGGNVTFTEDLPLPANMVSGTEVADRIKFGTTGKMDLGYRSTGLKALDYMIGGYFPGQLIIAAGHPKQGKSTFVADLVARHLVLYPDQRVLLIPLELTAEVTLGWVAAVMHGMPLDEALAYSAARCFCVQHFGYLSPKDLTRHLRVVKRLGISLVVIDHITAACTSFDDGLQTRHLDAMLSYLKSEVNKLGVTCIAVTHVNMSGSADAMVTPNQLRGSYALAQLPDSLIGITRQEEGTSLVYSILPDRHTGRSSKFYLTFEDGKFDEFNTNPFE